MPSSYSHPLPSSSPANNSAGAFSSGSRGHAGGQAQPAAGRGEGPPCVADLGFLDVGAASLAPGLLPGSFPASVLAHHCFPAWLQPGLLAQQRFRQKTAVAGHCQNLLLLSVCLCSALGVGSLPLHPQVLSGSPRWPGRHVVMEAEPEHEQRTQCSCLPRQPSPAASPRKRPRGPPPQVLVRQQPHSPSMK